MIQTGNKIEAFHLSELPVGIGQMIQIGTEQVAVFKCSNGQVYAIENKSPHPKGGILCDGLVSGEYIFCPVYDWKISLKTGLVQAPDEGKVKTYPVQVENEKVYVTIE